MTQGAKLGSQTTGRGDGCRVGEAHVSNWPGSQTNCCIYRHVPVSPQKATLQLLQPGLCSLAHALESTVTFIQITSILHEKYLNKKLLNDCKNVLQTIRGQKHMNSVCSEKPWEWTRGRLSPGDSRSVRRWESGEGFGCSLKPSLQTQIFAVAQGRGGPEKSAGLGQDEQRPLRPSEVYFFLNYRPSGPVSKIFKVLEESWNSALPHTSSVSPEVPPHKNCGLKYILVEEWVWDLWSAERVFFNVYH